MTVNAKEKRNGEKEIKLALNNQKNTQLSI
jgi:hypothetical protein